MSVLLETSLGDIVIDLHTETRPRCSLNFLKLCKLKMYNYCLFHNVQRNFMMQTGDIDDKGGSSIYKIFYGEQAKFFEREQVPKMKHTERLTVSMVNDGNGYHGSQFLITATDNADVLDGVHTVFGVVVEGEDVIDQINEAYVDDNNKPFQDIRIHHTIVLHDPFDDPKMLPVPPRSPSPPPHVISSDRLAVGEAVNTLSGRTTEEVVDYMEEKELKANTQMLEIIGDLPDANVKPPEDVLFVCKLNPVTTSDDLEIIFSRFGSIKSCEVIRDWKTEDSLCYAFIEFTDVKDCETAYFKMDNVLIDERRIHVDFSQSVSRLYWNRNTKHRMAYNENSKDKQTRRDDVGSRDDNDNRRTRTNRDHNRGQAHVRSGHVRSRDRSPRRENDRVRTVNDGARNNSNGKRSRHDRNVVGRDYAEQGEYRRDTEDRYAIEDSRRDTDRQKHFRENDRRDKGHKRLQDETHRDHRDKHDRERRKHEICETRDKSREESKYDRRIKEKSPDQKSNRDDKLPENQHSSNKKSKKKRIEKHDECNESENRKALADKIKNLESKIKEKEKKYQTDSESDEPAKKPKKKSKRHKKRNSGNIVDNTS